MAVSSTGWHHQHSFSFCLDLQALVLQGRAAFCLHVLANASVTAPHHRTHATHWVVPQRDVVQPFYTPRTWQPQLMMQVQRRPAAGASPDSLGWPSALPPHGVSQPCKVQAGKGGNEDLGQTAGLCTQQQPTILHLQL